MSAVWDNGEFGNYWSKYDEEDEGCFDVNNDRICDNSFIGSPLYFQDNYPLINPTISCEQLVSYTKPGLSKGLVKKECSNGIKKVIDKKVGWAKELFEEDKINNIKNMVINENGKSEH